MTEASRVTPGLTVPDVPFDSLVSSLSYRDWKITCRASDVAWLVVAKAPQVQAAHPDDCLSVDSVHVVVPKSEGNIATLLALARGLRAFERRQAAATYRIDGEPVTDLFGNTPHGQVDIPEKATAELVRRLTYKPGWTASYQPATRQGANSRLVLSVPTDCSLHPGKRYQTDVAVHVGRDRPALVALLELARALQRFETHESSEQLQLGGVPLFEPEHGEATACACGERLTGSPRIPSVVGSLISEVVGDLTRSDEGDAGPAQPMLLRAMAAAEAGVVTPDAVRELVEALGAFVGLSRTGTDIGIAEARADRVFQRAASAVACNVILMGGDRDIQEIQAVRSMLTDLGKGCRSERDLQPLFSALATAAQDGRTPDEADVQRLGLVVWLLESIQRQHPVFGGELLMHALGTSIAAWSTECLHSHARWLRLDLGEETDNAKPGPDDVVIPPLFLGPGIFESTIANGDPTEQWRTDSDFRSLRVLTAIVRSPREFV